MFEIWEQAIEWLRGSAPLQMQAYALVVGTLYFLSFWLIDHLGSHFMVRWLPNTTGSAHFRPNILSLLRRMLLLCSTMVMMALDYAPMLLPHLPPALLELPLTFWSVPMGMLVVAVWLGLEVWIFGRLLPTHLSPSVVDFVRMSAQSKQTLISTPAYGALSARVNHVLYLLAYVHLVMLIYGYRSD